MDRKKSLLVMLIVSATAGFFVLQNGMSPTNDQPMAISVTTSTETATVTPAYEGCGFIWAYHNDPELTKTVDAAVKALDETASATATLFGEDCVYTDGHSTFGAMTTDFRVRSFFDDFKNEEAFGNWMKQVMDMILQIPADEIQGAMPGKVEFVAVKGDVETFVVRVSIQQYRDEAQGKSGTELFQMFSNTQ